MCRQAAQLVPLYVESACVATWGRPVTYYYSSTDPPLVLFTVFDHKYREETQQRMAVMVIGARPMLGACRRGPTR